jgi:hypothetical protein
MGILGQLFGSEKVMDAAIGGITKGFDALVYTDEEKAGDAAKERSEARSMIVDWIKNSQGQNIARRLIALIITIVWLLMYIVSAGLDVAVVWIDQSLRKSGIAISYGNRREGRLYDWRNDANTGILFCCTAHGQDCRGCIG